MEIRKVVNEVKNEYPKMEQVKKKRLQSSIPNKWIKLCLSSLGIPIVMRNNISLASDIDIAGDVAVPVDIAGDIQMAIPLHVQVCNTTCSIVQIISIVTFIITGLSILITKIKSKKQNETKKVKKWIKVIFIISIILFILSILAGFFINNM